MLKPPLPLVRTAISSQLVPLPVKTPAPKATAVVNRPLLAVIALFVTGPA